MRTAPDSRLGGVGVAPLSERVYRHLVEQGRPRSAGDVATELGLSVRAATGALRTLDRQALVTRSPTQPPCYSASPPELALEPLLARRREELAEIRLFAQELQGAFSRSGLPATDLVEVVAGREQVTRYYLQLLGGARTGFDALTRPPYASAPDALSAEGAAIGRGVHARSVYDSDGRLTVAERRMALGEEARAASDLPMTVALFDRRVGFVPLAGGEPGTDPAEVAADRHGSRALVVRPSPLLDALGALFDSVWARAVPLLSTHDSPAGDELDDRCRQVLLLMSDGLKDESIARALGLSRRTVQKCVSAAMTRLGARTRFQAALLAHDRGWLRD